jgi:hypothetical protein
MTRSSTAAPPPLAPPRSPALWASHRAAPLARPRPAPPWWAQPPRTAEIAAWKVRLRSLRRQGASSGQLRQRAGQGATGTPATGAAATATARPASPASPNPPRWRCCRVRGREGGRRRGAARRGAHQAAPARPLARHGRRQLRGGPRGWQPPSARPASARCVLPAHQRLAGGLASRVRDGPARDTLADVAGGLARVLCSYSAYAAHRQVCAGRSHCPPHRRVTLLPLLLLLVLLGR